MRIKQILLILLLCQKAMGAYYGGTQPESEEGQAQQAIQNSFLYGTPEREPDPAPPPAPAQRQPHQRHGNPHAQRIFSREAWEDGYYWTYRLRNRLNEASTRIDSTFENGALPGKGALIMGIKLPLYATRMIVFGTSLILGHTKISPHVPPIFFTIDNQKISDS